MEEPEGKVVNMGRSRAGKGQERRLGKASGGSKHLPVLMHKENGGCAALLSLAGVGILAKKHGHQNGGGAVQD